MYIDSVDAGHSNCTTAFVKQFTLPTQYRLNEHLHEEYYAKKCF